jgi:hypothetical protein
VPPFGRVSNVLRIVLAISSSPISRGAPGRGSSCGRERGQDADSGDGLLSRQPSTSLTAYSTGAKGEASVLDCPEDRRQFLDCVVYYVNRGEAGAGGDALVRCL